MNRSRDFSFFPFMRFMVEPMTLVITKWPRYRNMGLARMERYTIGKRALVIGLWIMGRLELRFVFDRKWWSRW